MRALLGQLALLLSAVRRLTGQQAGVTFKCCGVSEQLDPSGRCVDASWAPVRAYAGLAEIGVQPASDEAWLRRWYPPGRPRDMLFAERGYVVHSLLSATRPAAYRLPHHSHVLREYNILADVNRSYFFEEDDENAEWTRSLVLYNGHLLRFGPRRKVRVAAFCVDAVRGHSAPYAVVFRTIPSDGDLFSKCCRPGRLLASPAGGRVRCVADSRAWSAFGNSSLAAHFDAETPFRAISAIEENVPALRSMHFHATRMPRGTHRYAQYVQQFSVEFLSSTWMYPCADLARDGGGGVAEVLGYFVIARRARAAYMVSRHLCFASALVLLAALAAIGCKGRMRTSAHGWALGCHAVCLLLFNVGQIVYYWTTSDLMDKSGPYGQKDEDSRGACLAFAMPMYFLLSSANVWMTAVCANMFLGFKLVRNNQGSSRAAARELRRFVRLAALAWGAAAALSAAAGAVFLAVPDEMVERDGDVETRPWYRPSFVETRTCYMEIGFSKPENILKYRSQKLGTTLYYYLPSLILVAANSVLLCLTGLKVRYLRRGNSLLKRDEREGGGKTTGGGGGPQDKGASEPKSVTVYVKLMLAGGVLEFLAESLAWAVSSYHPWTSQPSQNENQRSWQVIAEMMTFQAKDHVYAHRVAGYWADLFRALVVLWLAVPEPFDLRAAWRRMRGQGGDSPAQGAATRAAPRPAPRTGLRESAL